LADSSALLQTLLESIYEKHRDDDCGEIPSYIPELGKANPEHFGIAVATAAGGVQEVGDSQVPFTIQSISKPLVFGAALEACGMDQTYRHVGTEPTGDAFNSILFENGTNRPFNPMVNSGAIAMAGLLHEKYGDRAFETVRSTFGRLAGRDLDLDWDVYRSEKETGHRNRALAYLMRSSGILGDAVEDKLDLYFRQCSIPVTARDLAVMGATLANIGTNPLTGDIVFGPLQVRHILSVMFTCGMYNYAGRWAVDVGLPAKSGVGGGVMAVVNRQIGIGLFSPRLDERGNSVRGIQACISLAEELGLHAFEFTNAGSGLLDAYL
jgi:glutaminase